MTDLDAHLRGVPREPRPPLGATGSIGRLNFIARAARRAFLLLVFVVVPAYLIARLIVAWGTPHYAWDFRAFYEGGADYLAGRSPYPETSLAALTARQGFVYPAPMAALIAPLTLLPFTLVAALFMTFNAACIALALRVLGVRDWRCYGIAFVSLPVMMGIHLGTLMPFLALLLALLWRHRERRWLAPILLAVLVVSKLFLWPLAFWFAARGRWRAALAAGAASGGACIAAYLPLGLEELWAYPKLLSLLSEFEHSSAYSLSSLATSLGAPEDLARLVPLAAGGMLVPAVVIAARRGGDFLAFRLALLASLVASPIVWGHYFVLLLVPVAVLWPRLSLPWIATAWIPGETFYFGTEPTALLVLAFGAALIQLGFVRGLPAALRGWFAVRLTSPTRPFETLAVFRRAAVSAGGIVLVLVLLFWAVAPFRDSAVTVATLRTATDSSWPSAEGTALLRVNRAESSACIALWTDGLDLPRVAARLAHRSTGTAALEVVHLPLTARGNGHRCIALSKRISSRLHERTRLAPREYVLLVAPATGAAPTLRGSLASRTNPVRLGTKH